MKTRYILQTGAGLVLAAVGIFLRVGGAAVDTALSTLLIVVGTVMVMMGAFNHRRFGDGIESDERTRKIDGAAASWSWFATLILLCALFWANELELIAFDMRGVFAALLFFMVFSAAAFSWCLARREAQE
ncbi:hypothetical protein [Methanofollis tationis]|uniref:DUF2178 domain-containing protein n=1 Tax=Methanofollis tationis TaxID=81417 RepID=A0A7K4HQE0_9EURY|nr:hypothetical protein [Methanofollis tationis]NVO67277.1 hypothetical protein [Methanofollis tationis]